MTQQIDANAMADTIFGYIVDFKRQNDGISPTMREIGRFAGIDSTSHISWYLRRLQRDGKIELIKNGARGIVVKGGKWEISAGTITAKG